MSQIVEISDENTPLDKANFLRITLTNKALLIY